MSTDADALFLEEWRADRESNDVGEWADPGDEFWTSRPALDHVRSYARAVMASPWATLGVVLARVIAATPPHVVLPALVGGHGSLNMYVGIVGRPGQGKGAADNAGAAAVELPEPLYEISIGSGEGIAHMFKRRQSNGDLVELRSSAFVTVGEVSTLEALGHRAGSVLLPELRKGWMGEPLGFGNADPRKTIPIGKHEYRLCLSAGIQPQKAQAILDDSEGGLPQRFIWLPAIDPSAPPIDIDEMPEAPDPLIWKLPDWGDVDYRSNRYILHVCRAARRHILERRDEARRGESGDPLDAHGGFARLKVAAGLGLLDGHAGIRDSDWQLSGLVMAESNATRSRVIRAIQKHEQRKTRQRAEIEAEKTIIVSERVASEKAIKAGRNIVRKLSAAEPGEWVSAGKLRAALRSDREWLDEAFESLAMTGVIEAEAFTANTGTETWRYRIKQGQQ